MGSNQWSSRAGQYLKKLCIDIPTRRVGAEGNRLATDFFAGIMEKYGRDSCICHLRLFLVKVRAAEEGFVLLHRFTFIVVNCPPFSHPSIISILRLGLSIFKNKPPGSNVIPLQDLISFPLRCLAGFCLDLFLDFTPEPV